MPTRIYLNKKDNPDFYNILEEYNSLMEKWNSLNNRIVSYKIPQINLFNIKKELRILGEEGLKLQNEYLRWNKKATKFALEPNYTFDQHQNQELTYLHFTSNMRHTVNYMNSNMVMLTNSYNTLYSSHEQRVNFNTAISAFAIGIVSLFIALFSYFVNDNESLNKNVLNQNSLINSIQNDLFINSTKLDSILGNSTEFEQVKIQLKEISKNQNRINKSLNQLFESKKKK